MTLTDDQKPLTVDFDRAHLSVTQWFLAPPVGVDDVDDLMLTSAGPHLSARNRDANVMLTSCGRQQAMWTNHSVTRVSPGLIQPFPFSEMI